MFNLKEFVKENLVNGVNNGTFSKEYASILAVNYLTKGIITEEDVSDISTDLDRIGIEPVEEGIENTQETIQDEVDS